MKDVTKYPHADGQAPIEGGTATHQSSAHNRAFLEAVNAFIERHGRNPEWDIINFRGFHSTTTVVIEIWEEA